MPVVFVSTPVNNDREQQYFLPRLEWITPTVSTWVVTDPPPATTILDKRLIVLDLVG